MRSGVDGVQPHQGTNRAIGLQPPPFWHSGAVMQPLNERQNDIIALARLTGRVTVEDLAARFDVTPQTIRRDLNELCDRRVLTRTHGGALITS